MTSWQRADGSGDAKKPTPNAPSLQTPPRRQGAGSRRCSDTTSTRPCIIASYPRLGHLITDKLAVESGNLGNRSITAIEASTDTPTSASHLCCLSIPLPLQWPEHERRTHPRPRHMPPRLSPNLLSSCRDFSMRMTIADHRTPSLPRRHALASHHIVSDVARPPSHP